MTPHNLPQNWQWVKLGEICQINPKTDFDNFSDSQIVSFIPMKCVEEKTNHFITETRTFQEVKKGYTKFQNQDILFAKITPCMENGKLCIVNNLINQKGLGSTEFHILRCNHRKVLPHFVFFFMVQDSFLKTMEYQMTGAVGQKRIKAEIIANHQIPLPPLEIQREIVGILESKLEKIKEAKALLKTSLQECETYRLSLLESAFSGNLTPHSQDWQWVKLEEVIQIIGGGTPNTTIDEYWNGNISWLSIADFNCDEKFVSQTQKSITEKGLKESSTRMLEKGDIIISARGTIGAVAILDKPMAFNQSCYGIKAGKKIDTDYLYWTLKHFSQSLKNDSYGVCLKAITKRNLSELSIPLPPLEIQREIVEILESKLEKIKEAKALLETSLQECETYRLSLLESAFAGELV